MLTSRRIALLLTAVLCLAAWGALAWGQAGGAAPPPDDDPAINLDVRDGQLGDVLAALARGGQVDIIWQPELVQGKLVNITITQKPLSVVLRSVLTNAGLYFEYKDGIYNVLAEPPAALPGPVLEGPVPTGPPAPPPGGTQAVGMTPPAGGGPGTEPVPTPEAPRVAPGPTAPTTGPQEQVKPQVIPLQYANAGSIARIFGGQVFQMEQRPFLAFPGVRHDGDRGLYGPLGAGDGADYGLGLIPGTAADRTSVGGVMDAYMQRGGGFGGGGRGGGGFGGGGMGGGFGGGMGGMGGMGGGMGGMGGGRGGLGGGMGGMGGGLGGLGGGMGAGSGLQGLLANPPSSIWGFLDLNQLIVTGTQQQIDEFRELVQYLDVPTREVEVSLKFVTLTTTFEKAFGLDWAIHTTAIDVYDQGFAPGNAINTVIRYATGNLITQLNAMETDGVATVITEPRIVAQNNQFAGISFYTEYPYITSTVTYNNFGQSQSTPEVDYADVEQDFYVMPRINADDSVTMYLEPTLSNIIGFVASPDGGQIPIQSEQEIMTQLRVQDGETAVLGGLITKNDNVSRVHTPLLSRIPIIGKIFSSKTKSNTDEELLIFVTPRIIRSSGVQ